MSIVAVVETTCIHPDTQLAPAIGYPAISSSLSHTRSRDRCFEVSNPPSLSGQADETPLLVSPGERLRDARQIKVVS